MDAALEATAAEAPQALLQVLVDLKATCVRVATGVERADIGADFTNEDQMYVVECVRRYIPDSLSAYLSVPRAQRSVSDTSTQRSADDILVTQLSTLTDELLAREKRLQSVVVEPLLRQQRFLESKKAST